MKIMKVETKISCENCVHEKVCNKKNNYLEILKDFHNYVSSINIDDVDGTIDVVTTIECDDYMKKPTSILMYNDEVIKYL